MFESILITMTSKNQISNIKSFLHEQSEIFLADTKRSVMNHLDILDMPCSNF